MPKTAHSRGATMNIRLGVDMKEAVQRYAKARDMSPSEFVRYCVWTYMDSTVEDDRLYRVTEELNELLS